MTVAPTIRPDAAPTELKGQWRTTMAPGDIVTLRIGDNTYRILRGGPSVGGQIAVNGSQIEFYGNSGCEGSGFYEWAIANGVLTLETAGARDPCPRWDVLEGREFTRLGGG